MSTDNRETTETTETTETKAKKQGVKKIVTAINQGNLEAAVKELMTHPVTRQQMSYADSRMMYG